MIEIDAEDKTFLKGLTVLYVEDEEDARDQFAMFLERITGRLIVAANGKEGLDLYHDQHPDIIITDIQMPVMDGLTMVRDIRKSGGSVQIIILTAFDQSDYLLTSASLGVNTYIGKPVEITRLYRSLLASAHSLMIGGQAAKPESYIGDNA